MSGCPAPFEIVAADAPLGAYVRGLDLAAGVSEETVAALQDAFSNYMVLVFGGQRLDRARLREIIEWFGPPFQAEPEFPVLGAGDGEFTVVSNVAEDGVLSTIAVPPHSDEEFLPTPPLATALYAVEVPARGGETAWSNLCLAYDELGTRTRRRVARLKRWTDNPFAGRAARRDECGPNQRFVDHDLPAFDHPLVRTHRTTGRRSLFLSHATAGIRGGWSARRLFRRLKRHVDQPHLYFTHRWRPGDLAVWDNTCTNHRRAAFDPGERRVMHRVQTGGIRPD